MHLFTDFVTTTEYMWVFYHGSTALCWALAAFQFLNLYIVGRTPSTGDQPVARLLPTHRTAQKE
jgi:hypothetical protein